MPRNGLPKFCSWNIDRHGKRRVRFRRNGFSVYLTGTPWSDDFMKQYAAALGVVENAISNIGANRTIPGSFDAACVSYYKSPDFQRLGPISQKNRRNVIEAFRREHGTKPLARLEPRYVQGIIEARADTPQAANVLLKTLRLVLNHAITIGMIKYNPTVAVRGFKNKGDGWHTWTEAEVAQFEARHPEGSKARLALYLLLYTAQRMGDVSRMGWQHVRGDSIVVRQQKTDAPLLIPMHPVLARVLGSLSRSNLTILLTERGAPFSPKGFGQWVTKRCREAGLPQCSAHGLRKLAATRLALAVYTLDQIKAITGHKSASEVMRYTKDADQQRLARQALGRQLEAETRTEVGQPGISVGQKS